MEESLRSIDLYLSYPAGKVVKTKQLRDVASGMYLCYYAVVDDEVWASTSVTELVFELGELYENESYDPPDFLSEQPFVERLLPSLPAGLIERTPEFVGQFLRSKGYLSQTYWDESIKTIDRRINKLRPFEQVTPTSSKITFEPTLSLSDPAEFVSQSAKYIMEFVHDIEKQYPDYDHIVRVGGMDSQLILLVPKLCDENWHAFSADPNYSYVEDFVESNNIPIEQLYRHNNKNEESKTELERKLICSDLRSDPRHLRWYPTLERIAEKYDGNVIFWDGTEGDTIYSYHAEYQSNDGVEYFNLHQSRAANWQSVTHQVTKNYTGAAALSPYHSEQIWNKLYRHYDPAMINKGTDLRNDLGKQLAGRPIEWPDKNPGPTPYSYDISFDPKEKYKEYILDVLNQNTKSVIANR